MTSDVPYDKCTSTKTVYRDRRSNIMVKSPLTDIVIPDNVSLADFILHRVEQYGPRTALIDGISGRCVTYSEIRHQAAKLAGALWWRYKLSKGYVVCLFLPNCPEYIILAQSVLLTGATVTTCNPAYKPGELKTQLEDCSASIIITNEANLDTVTAATSDLHSIKDIVLLDADPGSSRHPTVGGIVRQAGGALLPPVRFDPLEDIAMLLYSSGTTGKPKGVMLTHHCLIANILQFCHPTMEMGGPKDVFIVNTPMFHIYGLNVILNGGMYMGATLVTLPRFQPDIYLSCIEKYKVTFLHVTPPTALFLSQHPLVDKYNTTSLHTIFSGGAPLPENVAEAVHRRLNVEVRQGYGMTEASPCIIHTIPRSRPYSSIGVPLPNTEVKVQDIETGKELKAGQVGEIVIHGPQVMKGYLGNKVATDRTISKDGWLHTGDLGYYNEDGIFFIVDRLKELVKYKAFQVAPAELESLLLSHPAIEDAAVVGRPDGATGELPTAFVVTKGTVSANTILKFVADNVASYKQLRGGVVFVDVIPKSPSGKILRRMLKERLIINHKL